MVSPGCFCRGVVDSGTVLVWIPAFAGMTFRRGNDVSFAVVWIPAFAGMTSGAGMTFRCGNDERCEAGFTSSNRVVNQAVCSGAALQPCMTSRVYHYAGCTHNCIHNNTFNTGLVTTSIVILQITWDIWSSLTGN